MAGDTEIMLVGKLVDVVLARPPFRGAHQWMGVGHAAPRAGSGLRTPAG
jgi:hypothetical protein